MADALIDRRTFLKTGLAGSLLLALGGCAPVAPNARQQVLAAIANAVYDATGIRVTGSPITPMQLLRLLQQRHTATDDRREPSCGTDR